MIEFYGCLDRKFVLRALLKLHVATTGLVLPAGKTTLLQLLAGKYMVPRDRILVLGESPFYNTVSTPTPASVLGAHTAPSCGGVRRAGSAMTATGCSRRHSRVVASSATSELPGVRTSRLQATACHCRCANYLNHCCCASCPFSTRCGGKQALQLQHQPTKM